MALGALEPLDASVARIARSTRDDYFAGIWDTNVVGGALYGVPWYVDTRLLFYRRDLLAHAGFSAPPRRGPSGRARSPPSRRTRRPDRYAILLPMNEFEPLLALALQQDDPLLRDGGRCGNFRSAGFRRALTFYVDMFRRGYAPPITNAADLATYGTSSAAATFAFYISGPWNIGEFKRRLPADRAGDWTTAPLPGPDGPGASIAGGSSLVLFRASRAQGRRRGS